MASPAIRVDRLSKLYQVGARQPGYTTLRESLNNAVAAPWRCLKKTLQRSSADNSTGERLQGENFWALKDVSFEVQPGEVVGIIGRNGAGKSTLLKVLSRITEPTSGRIELRGRVGSLLEVGTGFHPELTGRENIFMNGSILGMSRREIQRKFDEIVNFAEVEDFLDTPVKRYSSGMYVRLAFAVAAHLEPEILIVDEVLAVGDIEFQKKCLGKMQDVACHGRTVLFVSHNLGAVRRLCSNVLLINGGRAVFQGDTEKGVSTFLQSNSKSAAGAAFLGNPLVPGSKVRLLSASVESPDEWEAGQFPVGAKLFFTARFECDQKIPSAVVGIRIDSESGLRITTLHTACAPGSSPDSYPAGEVYFECQVQSLALPPGRYHVRIEMASREKTVVLEEDALTFDVLQSDFFGNGCRRLTGDAVLCKQLWKYASRPNGAQLKVE